MFTVGRECNRHPRRFGSYHHCDCERRDVKPQWERISCEIEHVQDACLAGQDSAWKNIRWFDLFFIHLVICLLLLRLEECYLQVVDCCPLFVYSLFFTFDKSSITLFIFLRLYKIDQIHAGPDLSLYAAVQ